MQNGYAWVDHPNRQSALVFVPEYTFEQGNGIREFLVAATGRASAILQNFPRNSVGLVSDAVRATSEYQNAQRDFQLVFEREQKFNRAFCKKFKKEYAAYRAALRAKV